jgi:glycosyltransferase involved in cell wall biosynthesis
MIHFHRALGPFEEMESTLNRIKALGIITIMDLDDYWSPGKHHPAYSMIKNSGIDKMILNNIKLSENVITTTPVFAKEISKYNKNVHVLPNAIDPNESQFVPNPQESDRIRIGWLGGSCMPPDTEILTDNGWKRFDKLNQTEKVATLNLKSNLLEYNKPTGYIREPFEGELNCGKNGVVEYMVTPNHNMFASEVKNLGHKKLDLKLIQSTDLHGKNFHIKRDANWIGVNRATMIIPAMLEKTEKVKELVSEYNLIEKNGKRKNYLIEKYGEDKYLEMDKWLQFFGFWMAEGWTSKSDGLYQVGIAQSKDNDYLQTMFDILIDLGYKPTFTKDGKQVRVFDRQLWSYLRQFGNSYEKFIPNNILELCPYQLNLFLEWFIRGDGHIENNKYKRMRAWTSSKKLADGLQEIALKVGISSTITNRGKKTTTIKNRDIINQHDSYQVNFGKHPLVSKHNKNTPLVNSKDQYKKYYKGNVYCVEVPNHVIYVRRNGKPFWIGNSHLKDLEILQGVVGKIKSDGLLDKVQFVLCGFDLRGTMTTLNEKTGERSTRPIKPTESVWYNYEKIFTNNYAIVSPEYKEHLLKFTEEEFDGIEKEAYRRVWTKPISNYATNYNLFDVSLAPLEENLFNQVKSQLKVIEAGFHKKAIIAQDFGPYKIDLINYYDKPKKGGSDMVVNVNGNALLVETRKNHKDWYRNIKRLVTNPEIITELSEKLNNDIKDVYSIDAITKKRRDLYLSLIKSK